MISKGDFREERERQAVRNEFSRIENEYETFLEMTGIFAEKFHDVSAGLCQVERCERQKEQSF